MVSGYSLQHHSSHMCAVNLIIFPLQLGIGYPHSTTQAHASHPFSVRPVEPGHSGVVLPYLNLVGLEVIFKRLEGINEMTNLLIFFKHSITRIFFQGKSFFYSSICCNTVGREVVAITSEFIACLTSLAISPAMTFF